MYRLFLLVVGTLFLTSLTNAVAITGVQGGVNTATGERPSRQEFSSFQSTGAAFDLYVLSFQRFVQQNQSSILSYYQVAGIHGHPYIDWDGVSGPYKTGYCTHGSILFPTWHRPYLAVFEQVLWKNAQDIAATYSTYERAKYQAAAVTFRIPYWDWASNPMMPAAVSQPTIMVNTPRGPESIVNPLYNYTFHPQPPAAEFPPDEPLSAYHSTVRYPNSAGQSQPDLVNKQLLANGAALRTLTYQLIAQQSSYAPFSNTGYTDGRGGLYNSLENMHNAIHGLVGNGGHMGSVPYSAFDPIFWLHHANVDRLFAIWQAIYPDSFVTYQTDSYGTYTNAPGGAETADTPLTPFHATALGVLYTSTTARYTKTFGYTYPEIIDWNISTTQLSTNVRTKLNALYNSPNPISKRHTSAATNTTTTRNSTTTHHHHHHHHHHQYFINIRVASNALTPPSSSFIHFFLGSFPDNPRTWSYDPALIASHTVIASLYPPSLPNSTTYGQIPLSHSLLAAVSKGIIPNLHPANVIPLLKRDLQWRVQRFDDSAVDVEEVRALKMQVVGQEVRDIGEGGFPGFGEMVELWDFGRGGEVGREV